jgi:hypothetical protein
MIEKICWALIALIHHRAGLFVVILVICLWAFFRPEVRPLAAVTVGISMGSFVLIWWLAGASPALRGIAIADMIGLLILVYAGFQAFRTIG